MSDCVEVIFSVLASTHGHHPRIWTFTSTNEYASGSGSTTTVNIALVDCNNVDNNIMTSK